MYRTLGELLPQRFHPTVRITEETHVVINSPIMSLVMHDGNTHIQGILGEPVVIDFQLLETQNRTSPQCVFWHGTANKRYIFHLCQSWKICQTF